MIESRLRIDVAAAQARGLEIRPHRPAADTGFIEPVFSSFGSPSVLLRLSPAVLAKLEATIGEVAQLGVREEVVPLEAVSFHGTAEARTEHLVSSGLTVSTQGTSFDVDGNPVSVSVTADAAGQLRASQPFYGDVIVGYTTRFRLLRYRYEVTTTSTIITGGVTRITGGTVLAFHGGEVARFQVPPPEAPPAEEDKAQVYRDVSYGILQEGEEYERPPGWPDQTWGNGLPDPDEGWTEVERVHAIGRMERFCRLGVNREYITPALPHRNSNIYQIPIERIVASDDSLLARGLSAGCIQRAKAQMPEALG